MKVYHMDQINPPADWPAWLCRAFAIKARLERLRMLGERLRMLGEVDAKVARMKRPAKAKAIAARRMMRLSRYTAP